MDNKGIVKEIDGNQIKVSVFKSSTCGKCDKCIEGSKFSGDFTFFCEEKLNIGDEINFTIADSDLLKLGLLVYIVPVFSLFLFYFIGELIFKKEIYKIMLSISSIVLFFIFLFFYDKSKGKKIIKKISIKKEVKI